MPPSDEEKSAGKPLAISLPAGFDWRCWVDRWDRMQQRYLVRRAERFDIMTRAIRGTQESVSRVLDLGCGTGCLSLAVLETFAECEVYGIDFDPTMLLLAERRLERFGDRVHLVQEDLRGSSWVDSLPAPFDAAVSATTLHWLTPVQLAALYSRIGKLLRPGGIFLNADHVGSDSPLAQKAWERHRQQMRCEEADGDADDWDGFWDAYGQALGVDIGQIHQRLIGDWETVSDDGLPLAWHFDKLRASGFESVDCFWRCDCDAIYGGIRAAG